LISDDFPTFDLPANATSGIETSSSGNDASFVAAYVNFVPVLTPPRCPSNDLTSSERAPYNA